MNSALQTPSLPWPTGRYLFAGGIACALSVPIALTFSVMLAKFETTTVVIKPAEELVAENLEAGRTESAAPTAAGPSSQPAAQPVGQPMITKFQLIQPKSAKLCATNDPWLLGETAIANGATLPGQSCFAIRLAVASDSNVAVLIQDNTGKLSSVLPNTCEHLQSITAAAPGKDLLIPTLSSGKASNFSVESQPGEEHLFVIAMRQDFASTDFAAFLGRVPNICAPTDGVAMKTDAIRTTLETVKSSSAGAFDWSETSFSH